MSGIALPPWANIPEAYLETDDENSKAKRIEDISARMREYLQDDLFEELKDTVILVERRFPVEERAAG